jgi:maltose/moltooligosaccharide transporter
MKNTASMNLISLCNMSFGFFGIQFGWGLQMANMSSIYQMLGADEASLPLLWLAAPLTGLLVQPIIGHMSDRTWCRLGRRRPYFLIGAVLASIALVFMPHSSSLWMAAGLLWVLDGSVNISMEPFRAFVSDLLPEQQRTQGFAVQSLFIGLGSVLASSLPFVLTELFGVAGAAPSGEIPQAVHWAFTIGAGVFLGAVVWTVVTTPERPPADMEAFERMKSESAGPLGFLRELGEGLASMPRTMRQLAAVQFFTWSGLFCMWIYFSPAIASRIFGAVKGQAGYEELVAQAGQWTGVCFSVYNAVCFVFSFALVALARHVPARTLHIVCLSLGGLGLASVPFMPGKDFLFLSMAGVGIAWSSILSMPYALLANCIPAAKTGFYMGVFNFFIVLPQIAISLGLGEALRFFPAVDSAMVIMGGGFCFLLAAGLTLRVKPTAHTS